MLLLLAALLQSATQAPAALPAAQEAEYEAQLRAFRAEEARIQLPVDPRHKAVKLTPAWLAGDWVDGKAACYGSGAGITFTADGSFSNISETGRWSVQGDLVTLRVTEQFEDRQATAAETRVRIALVGPNEIDTWWDDAAEPARLYRCPAGGLKPPLAANGGVTR